MPVVLTLNVYLFIWWVPTYVMFVQLKGALSGLRVFGNWKPFKNDEKCFLFHLKRSFRAQDV